MQVFTRVQLAHAAVASYPFFPDPLSMIVAMDSPPDGQAAGSDESKHDAAAAARTTPPPALPPQLVPFNSGLSSGAHGSSGHVPHSAN